MTHKTISASELRSYARGADYSCEREAFNRAADEIERLQIIVEQQREQLIETREQIDNLMKSTQ